MKRQTVLAVAMSAFSFAVSAIGIYSAINNDTISGYINPAGVFYRQAFALHKKLAAALCASLGINPGTADPEVVLDRLGFVKVFVGHFYWDRKPTDQQMETMSGIQAGTERGDDTFVRPERLSCGEAR